MHVQLVRLPKIATGHCVPANAVAVASYLNYVDSRAVEDIVTYSCSTRSLHIAFLVCYFLRVNRKLRVGAGTSPLGKRTWIDHDNAIDHLKNR